MIFSFDNSLNKVVAEWKAIKNKLIQFPVAQLRLMMFKFCFCPKPIHLLRTIVPNRMTYAAAEFMKFQREIIESCFHHEIDDDLFDLLCLPIEHGGIGILNMKDILEIAHLASLFGCKTFREVFQSHFEENVEGLDVAYWY
jgi:hypothetical protein